MNVESAEPSLFEIKQWTKHKASVELFYFGKFCQSSFSGKVILYFVSVFMTAMDEWTLGDVHVYSIANIRTVMVIWLFIAKLKITCWFVTSNFADALHVSMRWLVDWLTDFAWISFSVIFALIIKSNLSSKSNCYQLLFWSSARIHFITCKVNIITNVKWFWIWFDEWWSLLEENIGTLNSKTFFLKTKPLPIFYHDDGHGIGITLSVYFTHWIWFW